MVEVRPTTYHPAESCCVRRASLINVAQENREAPFLLLGATAEAMRLYQSCVRGGLKVTLLRDTYGKTRALD